MTQNGGMVQILKSLLILYSLFLYKPQLYDDLIAKALEYLVKIKMQMARRL